MDVGKPYRALLSDLTGAVLRVLHDTSRPLTGRDIHRLAGGASVGGVRKALIRLVEHGLVEEQQAGSAILYTVNTAHLAWPAVSVLMTMRRELVHRVSRLMGSWEVQPLVGGIFGSTARGDGDSGSDVDVLLIRPELSTVDADDLWGDQMDDLRALIRTATGNRAQLLVLDQEGLRKAADGGEPIVDEWRRDLLVTAGTARVLDGVRSKRSGS